MQQRAVLADLLINIDEQDNTSDIQLGLGTGSFSSFMDQVQYTESLQAKVYGILPAGQGAADKVDG